MICDGICVATYPRHILAEEAVVSLRNSGIDTRDVSLVGRGYDPEELGEGVESRGRQGWERTGAFWGGIWEVGSSTFFVSDMGFVVVAGPLTRYVLAALESGFSHDGLSPVGVALDAVGVPMEDTLRYVREVRENRCLLVLPCPVEDLREVVQAVRDTRPRGAWTHERVPEATHR